MSRNGNFPFRGKLTDLKVERISKNLRVKVKVEL